MLLSGMWVKTGLRDRVVERHPELPEFEEVVGEEMRLLLDEPALRQLDLACGLEHVGLLVDPRVVARLEVLDEVDARAQRPAADVEEVVLRLQSPLDEIVELELAHVLPVRDVPNHAPVPVGIDVAEIARRQRLPQRLRRVSLYRPQAMTPDAPLPW